MKQILILIKEEQLSHILKVVFHFCYVHRGSLTKVEFCIYFFLLPYAKIRFSAALKRACVRACVRSEYVALASKANEIGQLHFGSLPENYPETPR